VLLWPMDNVKYLAFIRKNHHDLSTMTIGSHP
jgi:hypothetical protein